MSHLPKTPKIEKNFLSKSLFLKGLQCEKLLWFSKYKKEVLSPIDSHTQAIFDTGHRVGELACKLFDGGKKIEFERGDFEAKISQTKAWIDEGVETIYEATFAYEGLLVMVDILHKTDDGWQIYEVKSSTDFKDIHIDDVAIQKYVLEGLGYEIEGSYVVHINRFYIREEELDIEELFSIVDVDDLIEKFDLNIDAYLDEFREMLEDKINPPSADIGAHCKQPYECPAREYCWMVENSLPEFSIYDLFVLGSKKAYDLQEMGVIDVADIPEDFKLTPNQAIAVKSYQEKKEIIDKDEVKNFLDKLTYPIYHLDFETYQEAIPTIKGTRPYMQIPFQYSLHIEYEDGRLEHREFLADENSDDSRELLVESLVANIPDNVTTLAYYASFEKMVLKDLANSFLDHSEHLNKIIDNMLDLADPFKNRHYYLPDLKAKFSIKKVLPLLVPQMQEAYNDLKFVQNGGDAMSIYPRLKDMKLDEKEAYKKALLEYCKLDTLAMVKVLEEIRKVL